MLAVTWSLNPGSDTQAASSGITEEPPSVQVIEDSSDTPSPSTEDGDYHIGRSQKLSQPNSVKNPSDGNLYAETMDSPSG